MSADAFINFARSHGVLIRQLVGDGRIHACPTVEHPRSRNGRYRFDSADGWGWVQAWDTMSEPAIFHREKPVEWGERKARPAPRQPRTDVELLSERAAVELAQRVVARAVPQLQHPYMARKGLGHREPLVDTATTTWLTDHGPFTINTVGAVVVPMRHFKTDALQSVQWIDVNGEKLFLKGGKAEFAVHKLGPRRAETILCEGYATGLTILEALQRLYWQASVWVCFSAGNLTKVANALPDTARVFVAADHDRPDRMGRQAGHATIHDTGRKGVMPFEQGDDFNDVHVREGIHAVAQLIGGLRD